MNEMNSFDNLDLIVRLMTANPEFSILYSALTIAAAFIVKYSVVGVLKVTGLMPAKDKPFQEKPVDPVFDPLLTRIEESHPDHWQLCRDNWFGSTTCSGLGFRQVPATHKTARTYEVIQNNVSVMDVMTSKQRKRVEKALDDLFARSERLTYERKREFIAKRLRPLYEEAVNCDENPSKPQSNGGGFTPRRA